MEENDTHWEIATEVKEANGIKQFDIFLIEGKRYCVQSFQSTEVLELTQADEFDPTKPMQLTLYVKQITDGIVSGKIKRDGRFIWEGKA